MTEFATIETTALDTIIGGAGGAHLKFNSDSHGWNLDGGVNFDLGPVHVDLGAGGGMRDGKPNVYGSGKLTGR